MWETKKGYGCCTAQAHFLIACTKISSNSRRHSHTITSYTAWKLILDTRRLARTITYQKHISSIPNTTFLLVSHKNNSYRRDCICATGAPLCYRFHEAGIIFGGVIARTLWRAKKRRFLCYSDGLSKTGSGTRTSKHISTHVTDSLAPERHTDRHSKTRTGVKYVCASVTCTRSGRLAHTNRSDGLFKTCGFFCQLRAYTLMLM